LFDCNERHVGFLGVFEDPLSTRLVAWWGALNMSLDILKVSLLKNWCLDSHF